MGGDLHWAAGLSLITPIPTRAEWPLKGHIFMNAGRLVGFDNSESNVLSMRSVADCRNAQGLSHSLSTLLHEPALSAGFGLMYRHAVVRLEFNLGMPIAAHKGDGVRKGFQLGLGLHFL